MLVHYLSRFGGAFLATRRLPTLPTAEQLRFMLAEQRPHVNHCEFTFALVSPAWVVHSHSCSSMTVKPRSALYSRSRSATTHGRSRYFTGPVSRVFFQR